MKQYKLNQRIVYFQFIQANSKNYLGTIRYIGNLHGLGDERLWFGIEWDDPNFGSHDGCYKSKRYFHCLQLWKPKINYSSSLGHRSEWITSGSFVSQRIASCFDTGISFYAALHKRYDSDFFPNLQKTKIIDVSDLNIINCGEPKEALRFLDCISFVSLSKNPLNLFDEVIKILSLMNSLEQVDISSCNFYRTYSRLNYTNDLIKLSNLYQINISEITKKFKSIKEINFRNCKIEIIDFNIFYQLFPCLTKLNLSDNPQLFDSFAELCLESNYIEEKVEFETVANLSFQNCKIENFKKLFQMLKFFPNLRKLNISENKLLWSENMDHQSYNNIDSLSIENVQLSWQIMCRVSEIFPNLRSLSYSFNLFEIYSEIEFDNSIQNPSVIRYILILLFKNLNKLNGSFVNENERVEAEEYILTLWSQNRLKDPKNFDICEKLSNERNINNFHKTHKFYQETPLKNIIIHVFKETNVEAEKIISLKVPFRTKIEDLKVFLSLYNSSVMLFQKIFFLDPWNGKIFLNDDKAFIHHFCKKSELKIIINDS